MGARFLTGLSRGYRCQQIGHSAVAAPATMKCHSQLKICRSAGSWARISFTIGMNNTLSPFYQPLTIRRIYPDTGRSERGGLAQGLRIAMVLACRAPYALAPPAQLSSRTGLMCLPWVSNAASISDIENRRFARNGGQTAMLACEATAQA